MLFSNLTSYALQLGGFGQWMVSSAQGRLNSLSDSLVASTPSVASPDTTNMSTYTLPPLGYAYDALEPHFDATTMEIHHSKHHQTYVNNLNGAITAHAALAKLDVNDLVARLGEIPEQQRAFIRNNAGGHSNHAFFWRNLATGTTLQGPLKDAIEQAFGSVDAFKTQFETAAAKVFGSGWAWLIKKSDGQLAVVTTPNQDSPLMDAALVGAATVGFPIIGLDVWEHAYYLKFQNRRPDYIKAFWSVVNWDFAAERFVASSKV